jgi:nucleoside-diphosphate-sugar epimerase
MTLKKNKTKLKRVIILGGSGFIGSCVANKFYNENIKTVLISRNQINLESVGAVNKLRKIIKKNDIIIFVAANAPVKNIEMLNKNLIIAKNVIESLKNIRINHFIYISSDAVYEDSKKRINENSNTVPGSLHGFMHLIRETMLKDLNCLKTFVRPTLVFGSLDPHNGYGPNKFIRCAQSKKEIILFGKGEEKRDHIHVDNVADIVFGAAIKKIGGVINAVSGISISFYEIARKLQKIYPHLNIKLIKRNIPMPHNGYRAFNNSLLKKKFPDIKIIKLSNWINNKEVYKKYN